MTITNRLMRIFLREELNEFIETLDQSKLRGFLIDKRTKMVKTIGISRQKISRSVKHRFFFRSINHQSLHFLHRIATDANNVDTSPE